MKKQFIYISVLLVAAGCLNSCTKDLNQSPANTNTSETQYSTPQGYKQVLAKVYGSYSLVSSQGVGNSDISVPGVTDAGNTDFLRALFTVQETTTDNNVCAWNDGQLQAFHNLNWGSSNVYVNCIYSRSLFQITICNEFIRNSTDDAIAGHHFSAADVADIVHYRAEARFLRAYQYWVLMDLFGNPPFVTEADPIGKYIPKQIQRADLFNYIESELKAIDADLLPPKQNEYARVDQGAEWALLARMYLNAGVYQGTGKERYNDAITYASKVIAAGYSLKLNYKNLFTSDNDVANPEVILPIAYDAVNSSNYGGTTFLICSSHSNADPKEDSTFGIPSGGWLGNRSTQNLPTVFSDYTGQTDQRAMFLPGVLDVNDVLDFGEGLVVAKFTNKTSTGITPPSPDGQLCSTDFPLFRLAEMYLIYIEAVSRGGDNGDNATAIQYFNLLRERAYGNASGNITSYTTNDVLAERQKELYWECSRRTDLIRFGNFTSSSFLWPWKGGVSGGIGVDSHYNLFPIPVSEILANPNLKQNTGY